MNDIIVIEGPRATGKTTMTNLIKTFGYRVHKVERGSDPMGDLFRTLDVWSRGGKWVADRFHLTEYVMSSYYKRIPLDVLEANISRAQKMLEELGAKIVVLAVDRELRTKRIISKGRDISHRKDEMPEDDVYSSWAYASSLFGVNVMSNNNKLDQSRIIAHLLLGNKLQRTERSIGYEVSRWLE